MTTLQIQACNYIDRLITVEMRPSGLLNDITVPLYQAARARQGDKPLTLLAAERLNDSLSIPGSTVILSTGIGGPPFLPFGETDGPPGLAVLARTLQLAFDAKILVVVEDRYRKATIGALEAAGLTVAYTPKGISQPGLVHLIDFSFDVAQATEQSRALFNEYAPKAVIAIERPGPNRLGVIHNAVGHHWVTPQSNFHLVIAEARRRDVLTISMGEVGNEIGFGVIESEVRRVVPYADQCQCPCGGGAVSSTEVDVLVVAGGCNWACYGIEAALAIVTGKHEIMHDPDIEYDLVEACYQAGAVDGPTGRLELLVEGCSLDMSRSIAVLLRGMVLNWMGGTSDSWLLGDS